MADDYSDYSESVAGTYAQIVVPDYPLANPLTTSANGGTTTGSSFLRLGSSPSLSGSSPSGFTNSLALAQLIGGTATTYPNGSTALASNLSESADPSPDALPDKNEYAGDANYLLGFADDTRYHGPDTDLHPSTTFIDWVNVSNTVANRQAETNRLLLKGGWWDHSDGNRITTTSGDKIEVIQGNYKMVVLGRQDPITTDAAGKKTLAGNAFITDCSGGQVVGQDAGPTPNSLAVEWREDDGVWTMYQDNVTKGNVTTRSYGKQAQYFKGSKMYTEIGKDPGKYDGDLSKGVDDDTDPIITNYTWAKRIETYLGASGKPVEDYYYWIHAYAINNVQTAVEITNTYFATTWELTIGSKFTIVIGPQIEIIPVFKMDVGLAKFQFTNLTNVVTASLNEATALKNTLNGLTNTISTVVNDIREQHTELAADVAEIKEAVIDVNLERIQLANEVTELSTQTTQIASDVNVLACLMVI